MPGWIRAISQYNLVNWAVEAARQALGTSTNWTVVWTRLAYLAALGLFCTWFGTRAFRTYQRSV